MFPGQVNTMSKQKPVLTLVGPKHGGPSIDDVIALFVAITGRQPEADDLERARARLAKRTPAPPSNA
jgi:hypothetical protein